MLERLMVGGMILLARALGFVLAGVVCLMSYVIWVDDGSKGMSVMLILCAIVALISSSLIVREIKEDFEI